MSPTSENSFQLFWFCGFTRHPQATTFSVLTKSLFRKRNAEGAYYHTDADINADKSGQLASKLQIALAEFSKLGMTEILQGDLMFTDDVSSMDIDGESYYTFTPNTIMYAVAKNSQLGRKINSARFKHDAIFHRNSEIC